MSGNDPNPSSFAGSADGTVVTLLPGGYDVSENEDPHYAASYSADCKDGQIDYGETKTCTITNTRKPSSIEIEKVAEPTSVPEPGGPVTFTFTIRNTSPADTVTITELDDSIYGDLFAKGDCDALENKPARPGRRRRRVERTKRRVPSARPCPGTSATSITTSPRSPVTTRTTGRSRTTTSRTSSSRTSHR